MPSKVGWSTFGMPTCAASWKTPTNGYAAESACVYGKVGSGYAHVSRICRNVALTSGSRGNGRIAVKATAELPTASCIV